MNWNYGHQTWLMVAHSRYKYICISSLESHLISMYPQTWAQLASQPKYVCI